MRNVRAVLGNEAQRGVPGALICSCKSFTIGIIWWDDRTTSFYRLDGIRCGADACGARSGNSLRCEVLVMKLTDMVLRPELLERPRIDYRRVFAWMPTRTADEGWIWLYPVWKIAVEGSPRPVFSVAILPLTAKL